MARKENTLNRKLELLDQLRRSRTELGHSKEKLESKIQAPLKIAKFPQQFVGQFSNKLTSTKFSPSKLVLISALGAFLLSLFLGRKKRRHKSKGKEQNRKLTTFGFIASILKPTIKNLLVKSATQYALNKGLPEIVSKNRIGRSK